jgi:UDP-4-amino-4-deoxy-L-arabinose formyltransferase/UDP-glucuronic acid dehydrogenase (UDP-4-keto-hexauronic acid decarboxylating)
MTARRVAVFAYGGFGCHGINALVRAGAQLVQVFSHHDHANERCWWPAVSELSRKLAIPCELDADFTSTDPGSAYARLRELDLDFIFSFYFRSMLPERVLALARHGGYNLHGSLLPRYRGRAPINWQLVHGETRGGLSLHRMVRQADAGDLVGQLGIPIGPDDDAYALTTTLMALTPQFLDESLPPVLELRAKHTPQDHRLATVFKGRRPEDGRIDWNQPARRVHDLIRAVAPPWPGAFTSRGGVPIYIDRSRVVSEEGCVATPGAVLSSQRVACATGVIEVLAAADSNRERLTLEPSWIFESLLATTPASRSQL